MSRIAVIGDCLLDCDVFADPARLMPDAAALVVRELDRTVRAGGAGMAATMLADDGHDVELITAIPNDDAGDTLRRLLERSGISLVDFGADGGTSEKIRIFASGHPILRLDRGAPIARRIDVVARNALAGADAILVSDYGLGLTADLWARQSIVDAANAGTPVVWDPHPNGSPPVAQTMIATPNRNEVAALTEIDLRDDVDMKAIARAGRQLQSAWNCEHICVTLGEAGALTIAGDGAAIFVSAMPSAGDPCGAGDRFASELAAQLAFGNPLATSLEIAVQSASAHVARGAGVSAPMTIGDGDAQQSDCTNDSLGARSEAACRDAAAVAQSGGRVVATSGCFDLLHAGHVKMLNAARKLGDHLVVLLNSDRSVRSLKGSARPVVTAAERAAVLGELACVDGVVVFDQDTPVELLRALRPAIFAKGGDYVIEQLPEAQAMAEIGGEVIILPEFGTTSTTSLIEHVKVGARR